MIMSTISKEELTGIAPSGIPNVVLLGAGASRATCPKGDKNGKKLPLMSDFVDCLNLRPKLEEWGIDPNQNFEDIFNNLFEKTESEKTDELEKTIYDYFSSLELPCEPTLYDHLILALTETDFIASFNWDPLLLQAYRRNSDVGLGLPRLAFLHGNVMAGVCKEHNQINYIKKTCAQCNKKLEPINLLYPIKKKNYIQDKILSNQWQHFEQYLAVAFQFTIFGYSAPKTDAEAVSIMKKAWKEENKNPLLIDTTIITPNTKQATRKYWEPFSHSHYLSVIDDFYKSNIAKYPRKGLEQSSTNNIDAEFMDKNPIPRDSNFRELWEWCQQFTETENNSRKKHSFPPK